MTKVLPTLTYKYVVDFPSLMVNHERKTYSGYTRERKRKEHTIKKIIKSQSKTERGEERENEI